ncbi:unnamed protein product [Vitrella brassicaformis CCMP3155]|uniref:Uncharacterized protein n=1 Tax=Vitrella brassicaformis (strain CCMP3155) TaxID=1169540 RepID=A0A0G4GMC2_VITBC|nr:unnamed protein product [Vitrella brassicaformis CCMP3155]|eukprot:CEM31343.1 unnamed protein product [Vitrella brassicaformis CCMP3155]
MQPTYAVGLPMGVQYGGQQQMPSLQKTYDIKYTAFWKFLIAIPFLAILALVIGTTAADAAVVLVSMSHVLIILAILIVISVASAPRNVERTHFGYVLRTFLCSKTLRFAEVTDIVQIGCTNPVCYCGRTKGQLTDPCDGVLMKTDCCSYALIFSPACGSLQFIAENRPFIPAMGGQETGPQYQYPAVTLYQQQPLPPQPMQPVGGYTQAAPPAYSEKTPAPAASPVQKF